MVKVFNINRHLLSSIHLPMLTLMTRVLWRVSSHSHCPTHTRWLQFSSHGLARDDVRPFLEKQKAKSHGNKPSVSAGLAAWSPHTDTARTRHWACHPAVHSALQACPCGSTASSSLRPAPERGAFHCGSGQRLSLTQLAKPSPPISLCPPCPLSFSPIT